MSFRIIRTLALLLALAPAARAEDLCESRASIHSHVMYCDENWGFLPPAQTCVQEYSDLVSAEFPRLQRMLNERVQAAKDDNKQKLDFHTNDDVLKTSLSEVNYLLDYGKQVHTELEDYVYSLVLPIYDEQDQGADLSDPRVKERFEDRECYGEPKEEIEKMEARMRPWIDQLEKTKAQLQAMSGTTERRDEHLEAYGKRVTSPSSAGAPAPGAGRVPSGASPHHDSTITGDVRKKELPQ